MLIVSQSLVLIARNGSLPVERVTNISLLDITSPSANLSYAINQDTQSVGTSLTQLRSTMYLNMPMPRKIWMNVFQSAMILSSIPEIMKRIFKSR